MSHKKPKPKNLRNVLVTPFNIQWSKSDPEVVTSLQNALEELLPLAKLEKTILKLPAKGETKEKTSSSTPTAKKHNNVFRTYLAPGFQSVIRGLEKNELCCVILSSDVSPPMLPRAVCSYCNTYDTPLIEVPELKSVTKSVLGFSIMVLGLKKIAESPENHFFPIYEIVSENRCFFVTPFFAKQEEDKPAEEEKKCVFINQNPWVSSDKSKDFYLFRDKINERSFRPGTEVNSIMSSQSQLPSKHGMDEDFISFSKIESKNSEIEHSSNIPKAACKSDSNDNDSDCDSLDEDNIFFVDDKPDQMLLETGQLSREEKRPQTSSEVRRFNVNSSISNKTENATKKKVKSMNERYFSSDLKQDVKHTKIRNKEKKVSNQKPKDLVKADKKEKREKVSSTKFNPLTIKTIISNPKRNKRKKK